MTDPAARLPVLIFGAHIAALGVLRSLSARGISCYVADETTDVITRSRWYRPAERTLAETADSAELAAFLESLELPRAVLIACSDRWACAVAGLPPAIRERFPTSAPSRVSVEQFVDKDRFRALVDRLDIPRPRTLAITRPADLDLADDDQLVNGFLKPTSSQLYRRHFGTKGAFVHSRAEATQRVEEASAAGIGFLLQEWIPGGLSATILLDGFVDQHGRITAMTARRRIRENPERIGNTVASVGIALEEVTEATAAIQRLIAEIGYRGCFNVEFKRDERDGHYKIIEVNARPAWFIGAIARAGVDLPWMSYRDAQGLPVEVAEPYPKDRYAVYEIGDVAALMRAVGSRQRPQGSVLRPWLGDHVIFWLNDPMPAIGGTWQALTRRIGRLLGRSRRAPTQAA